VRGEIRKDFDQTGREINLFTVARQHLPLNVNCERWKAECLRKVSVVQTRRQLRRPRVSPSGVESIS
jgi:hypothetical protein